MSTPSPLPSGAVPGGVGADEVALDQGAPPAADVDAVELPEMTLPAPGGRPADRLFDPALRCRTPLPMRRCR